MRCRTIANAYESSGCCGETTRKAHQPSEIVKRDQVEKWLSEKVPLICRVLRREARLPESAFHFEFWTCGSFSDEALAFLNDTATRTRKYQIDWKDGAAVRAYASKLRPKAVAQMLEQHFFAHPLAHVSRNARTDRLIA